MRQHSHITDAELHALIRRRSIVFGGNSQLKIYGQLHCRSGKRMKRGNRVFFESLWEAKENGYRPCGQCMREEYRIWKASLAAINKL